MVKTLKLCNVVLASKSPRRKELLSTIVDDFKIVNTHCDELTYHKRPSYLVVQNAKNKAIKAKTCDNIVIGADTVVFYQGKYFLKPKDDDDAYSMLKMLSGKTHAVYTGVCVIVKGKVYTFYDKSLVKLKNLSNDDILNYIATGSPKDKAGAYGIQDNFVVDKYKGSYSNIMGLPLEKLAEFLKF